MSTNQVGQGQSIQGDRESPQLGSSSLGYSSVPGSNAFVGLQQVVHHHSIPATTRLTKTRFLVMTSLKR